MKKFLIVAMLLMPIYAAQAESIDLDQLLREVKQSQGAEGKINRERESRFLAEKKKQKRVLAKTRAALAQADRASKKLKATFDAKEAELADLELKLKARSGVLGELFGVARQVAGDMKAELNGSLTSAQFPGRSAALEKIAGSKALPTINQLETLWYTIQQEMTESGKVVKFNTQIMSAAGTPHKTQVVRIGAFNAIADGLYLHYVPETNRLAELARQPDSKYLDLAENIDGDPGETVDIAVDPTRGAILGMLVQTPDFFERIDQGGAIGYFTLFLGAVGLVIVLERLIVLTITARRMHRQMGDLDAIAEDNPLGRVLAASRQQAGDIETLELILDEAITSEVPALEKGLSLVKLLAAVAPLLGLLGTVTGMIATFQSISLYGTGDPKLMASGISEALVTTMLGLIVALVLLFLHSLVASRSKGLIQILDEQTAGMICQRIEQQ
ncbi:MAG: MotA/TolQ/ExbB proton channel family protein [Pseudomonadota bacterium]